VGGVRLGEKRSQPEIKEEKRQGGLLRKVRKLLDTYLWNIEVRLRGG